jgi:hypothetical protein
LKENQTIGLPQVNYLFIAADLSCLNITIREYYKQINVHNCINTHLKKLNFILYMNWNEYYDWFFPEFKTL